MLYLGLISLWPQTKIWANIEEILLKYKYTHMKKDDKFKNLKRNDSLTEEDLDIPYYDYRGI